MRKKEEKIIPDILMCEMTGWDGTTVGFGQFYDVTTQGQFESAIWYMLD